MPSGTPNINLNYLAWAADRTTSIVKELHCNYLFTYLFALICLFINELFNIGNLECGSDTELND